LAKIVPKLPNMLTLLASFIAIQSIVLKK